MGIPTNISTSVWDHYMSAAADYWGWVVKEGEIAQ